MYSKGPYVIPCSNLLEFITLSINHVKDLLMLLNDAGLDFW